MLSTQKQSKFSECSPNMTITQWYRLWENRRQEKAFYLINFSMTNQCFLSVRILEIAQRASCWQLTSLKLMGKKSLFWILKALVQCKEVMIEIANYLCCLCYFPVSLFIIAWGRSMSKHSIIFR